MKTASRVAVIAAIASSAPLASPSCARCPKLDAETHVITPAVDAGIPEAGTSPSQAECRVLCGDDAEDPNDPNLPHPTACRILTGDAGQPLVACDETAYEACSP